MKASIIHGEPEYLVNLIFINKVFKEAYTPTLTRPYKRKTPTTRNLSDRALGAYYYIQTKMD